METLIYHIENGGSTWQEKTVDVSSPDYEYKNKYTKRVCVALLHNCKG